MGIQTPYEQSMTYLRAVQTHNFLTQICEIFLRLKSYQHGRKTTFFPRCSGIGTLTFFPSQGANVGRGGGPEDLKMPLMWS